MAEAVTCGMCCNEVEPAIDVWGLDRLPSHDWYPEGPACVRAGWLVELGGSGRAEPAGPSH